MKKALIAALIFITAIPQTYGCFPSIPVRDLQVSMIIYDADCNSTAKFFATVTNNGEMKERSTLRFFVDGKEIWSCTRIVDVESRSSISAECKWKTIPGIHTITAKIDELINEANTANNKESQEIQLYCCAEGFLEEYKCSGNWKQQKYQHADCTIEWRNVEYCSRGCYNGECIKECEEGYVEEYRCLGSWLQRKYKYANCSEVWINYQFCEYGCLENYCLLLPTYCNLWVDVEVPSSAFVHEDLKAKVIATNYGTEPVNTRLDVYICSDFCSYLPCSSEIRLEPGDSIVLTCTSFLQKAGNYQLIVVYRACNSNYTVASPIFSVSNVYPSFLSFKPLEFEPIINLKNYYSLKRCTNDTIKFSIMNVGTKDSTFYLKIEGEASKWMNVTPYVSLKAKEEKEILANVTVPCFVSEGNYEFSVRVKNSKEAIATAFLSIKEEKEIFVEPNLLIILPLILILLVVISKKLKRRKEPETFEGDC